MHALFTYARHADVPWIDHPKDPPLMGAAPPSRWPMGLIGMLALVLGVEVATARREYRLAAILPREWKEANHAAKLARGSTIVALGDSLVKNAIVPQVVEARLAPGQSVYNLAASGGPMQVHYFLLRRLIESGAAPRAVVVDGQTLTLSPRSSTTPLPWHALLNVRELAEAAWSFRSPEFFAENAARMALPTLRHRATLRSLVTATVTDAPFDDPVHLWLYVAGWIRNKGCHLLPDRPDPRRADDPAHLRAVLDGFSGQWKCDPSQKEYAERLLSLAEANHVRVYWLMMPDDPTMNARRVKDGWWSGHAGFLAELQSRHPTLYVIDGHRADYPPEALNDVLHMSRTGAIAFSDALGSILAQPEHPQRWIELPRYDADRARDLAARSPVLDTTQFARFLAAKSQGASGVIRR